MSIPLAHEDELDMSLSEAFGLLDTIEVCHFCERPTRFMNLDTSTHVCVSCSFDRSVAELPNIECKAPKPKVTNLTRAQMELRQKDDDLFIEHRRLERQLQLLRNERFTVQKQLEKEGIVTKRPWDSSKTTPSPRQPRSKAKPASTKIEQKPRKKP